MQSADPEEAQRRILAGGNEANLLEALHVTEILAEQTEGSVLSIGIEGKLAGFLPFPLLGYERPTDADRAAAIDLSIPTHAYEQEFPCADSSILPCLSPFRARMRSGGMRRLNTVHVRSQRLLLSGALYGVASTSGLAFAFALAGPYQLR